MTTDLLPFQRAFFDRAASITPTTDDRARAREHLAAVCDVALGLRGVLLDVPPSKAPARAGTRRSRQVRSDRARARRRAEARASDRP